MVYNNNSKSILFCRNKARRQIESGVIIIYFKGYYFIYYIYVAAISYLNIYLNDIGITPTRLGFMNSFAKTLAIFILPFWGILADYFGATKKILQIVLIGMIISLLSFLSTEIYLIVFIIYIFYVIFDSPVVSLSDSLLLSTLKERADSYGKYRVFGSLSYMLFVTPFGYILEKTGNKNLFIIGAVILFLSFILLFKLPEARDVRVSRITDFKILLHNKELLYFLVFVFFIQVPLMANFTYFPIFFKAHGGGETLFGFAMLLAAGSELLIFQNSDLLFERFKIKKILIVSATAFALRWFLLASFPSPTVLLLTQLLHSVTYALFHTTAVNYISRIVGDGFRATGQNLYASTISISSVFSSLIGGVIYDNLGGSALYLMGSIISITAGLVYYFKNDYSEKDYCGK